MANADVTDELMLDCAELRRLAELTPRESVKELLTKQADDLEAKVKSDKCNQEEAGGASAEMGAALPSAPAALPPVANETVEAPLPKPTESQKILVSRLPTKTITTFGWDQSEKFVKVYVTLNGVHTLPKEDVTVDFNLRSFTLKAKGKDCINQLTINSLLQPLIAEKCHYKVKTDSVVVLLKKGSEERWEFLTQTEQRVKQKKKPAAPKSEGADPSAGIMDLMKQMYDDGDDEMKRQIAKAWTEAREKKDTMPLP